MHDWWDFVLSRWQPHPGDDEDKKKECIFQPNPSTRFYHHTQATGRVILIFCAGAILALSALVKYSVVYSVTLDELIIDKRCITRFDTKLTYGINICCPVDFNITKS